MNSKMYRPQVKFLEQIIKYYTDIDCKLIKIYSNIISEYYLKFNLD